MTDDMLCTGNVPDISAFIAQCAFLPADAYVVYLGEAREIAGLTKDDGKLEKLAGLEKVGAAKHYYLFGEYLDEGKLGRMGIETRPGEAYYAEVRIPRLLRYPITEQSRRVRLTVCEYRERATGQVKLFRFQGLEAAKQ